MAAKPLAATEQSAPTNYNRDISTGLVVCVRADDLRSREDTCLDGNDMVVGYSNRHYPPSEHHQAHKGEIA